MKSRALFSQESSAAHSKYFTANTIMRSPACQPKDPQIHFEFLKNMGRHLLGSQFTWGEACCLREACCLMETCCLLVQSRDKRNATGNKGGGGP